MNDKCYTLQIVISCIYIFFFYRYDEIYYGRVEALAEQNLPAHQRRVNRQAGSKKRKILKIIRAGFLGCNSLNLADPRLTKGHRHHLPRFVLYL